MTRQVNILQKTKSQKKNKIKETSNMPDKKFKVMIIKMLT